jgi:hypothetical protein
MAMRPKVTPCASFVFVFFFFLFFFFFSSSLLLCYTSMWITSGSLSGVSAGIYNP